ncbi:MBL fold metallo-hydrolase [Sulfitobacter alexandrii]|uniref:MBL fold metallo-hydrolase n=1 Tax=Sulfitobacter alexandrii TaxID=1917485 RepID=A0A1J0WK12_9RHOB|nr:MBL fold metallo-hydrolase [Sulfitobacter alexandrii]APE44658.1 MBL fold metallo-hydrolase [Sulfitobacter alexandrii]
MQNTFRMSRRSALAGAAALPLAAMATTARASAPMAGAAMPQFRRVTLGGFDVTTILAGTRTVESPHDIFGQNVDDETFEQVSQAAHIPADKAQFFFTPTVINTGSELVLFDTGTNADGTLAGLQAAGYSADQVDVVVLTHMHGDHIGGLMQGDSPTFPNAQYVTGQVEFDAWSSMDNEGFNTKVKPLADQMTFLQDGGSVASGITAMAAFGHTPGHMAYMIESDGKQLVLGADFANHYVWSLAHPDWEVQFDQDKAAAAETRRRLLDMLAADGIPFVGYHMPFPAFGYVEKRDDGFAYVPHSYQLML